MNNLTFIVLSIGDVFEGILMIVLVLVVLILLGIFMQWISHISGYGIRTRFGGTIANPNDWKNTKEAVNSFAGNVKVVSTNVYDKIRNYNGVYFKRIQDKSENKLEKLYIINDLKERGIISEQEFDKLKNEI